MSAPCREPAHAWRRAALPFLALVVAGGCASLAPVEPAPQVYTGRFSASIERGGEREAISGRFTLAASAQRITLDLASPLGNTLARVASDAGGATLTSPRADGTLATWQGDSADALAESVLGYRLPVTGLADWIAGRATPGLAMSRDITHSLRRADAADEKTTGSLAGSVPMAWCRTRGPSGVNSV